MTEEEKQAHLGNFKNALLKVAPEFFGIPTLNNRIHILERAFAYELYHQLRLIYNGLNWYVNGELLKSLILFPEYGLKDILIPDLVVHHHETTSEDIIAVEIKSAPQVSGTEIIRDLEKLEILTKNGHGLLNYEIGIFLIVNSNFREKLGHMWKWNRNKIVRLLQNNQRIAIWNIQIPVANNDDGHDLSLNPRCLEIINHENIGR